MIKLCAELCKQSYDDAATGYVEVEDLRYGIRQTDTHIIVVIRGTANAENWLRDADVIPKKSCRGFIAHAGFVNSFQKLCAAGLLGAIPTGKPIIATGHSLGGAVATLLAERLNCRLITFGSPRVYFRFFSTPVLDHVRVIGEDDPVPGIPRIMYRHLTNPIVLTDDGLPIDISDHFMATYLAKLALREDIE